MFPSANVPAHEDRIATWGDGSPRWLLCHFYRGAVKLLSEIGEFQIVAIDRAVDCCRSDASTWRFPPSCVRQDRRQAVRVTARL